MNDTVSTAGKSSEPGPAAVGGVTVSSMRKPVISDFEIIRTIGRGSYGDVWLARGLTGVYRAIKVVWRDRFDDAEPFDREFKGLKKFSSMSLPDAGQLALLHIGQNEAGGFFYYVMELADDAATGREVNPERYTPLTLKEVRSRRTCLPAAECVVIGVELARALAGLHSHGLVHRDIKPSNVIMVGGLPKLADIGLVASIDDARTYVGTAGYMPPEGPGKSSADVFALGKLLYELATGLDREDYPRLPEGLGQRPDRARLLELNEVILQACDPDERQRYPDASAMLADLSLLQEGHSLRLRRSYAWAKRLGAVSMLLVVALGAGYWWRMRPATVAPARPSEARQLEAKAWGLMNKSEIGPEDLEFADGFCKRASELDPIDADAWAAWSQVNTLFVANRYDQSAARREAARADAARALKIAPASYEARLAQACYLLALEFQFRSFVSEAERMLLQLIRERPDEPRALYAFGNLQARYGRLPQARQAMIRLTRNPEFAARAWVVLAIIANASRDYAGYTLALDRSIAIEPYGENLSLKLDWYLYSQGDLDGADALVNKIPASIRQGDAILASVFITYLFRREPDKALAYLHGIARDWYVGGDGPGPIGLFIGQAQELAGRQDIARIEWEQALKLTEQKLADQPSSRKLITIRSRLLIFLGRFEEAEKSIQLGGQAGGYTDWYGIYLLRLREGKLDEAMDLYENKIGGRTTNAASLRLDPRLDPLRKLPRFKALLAEAEVDPDRMPDPTPVPPALAAAAAKPN